ncbi:MAG: pyridoxamine 5'-phosphate oxidase family protein [Actinomycetota bacterium]|nr:pyridoxamine 5'-phosphate oxidase family protein [Actinomycetota bacterium]
MKTDRTTLRRLPERGSHDPDTVEGILDEALICHLGLVDAEGRPFVIPTIHARIGDVLYLHGSPASRALRAGSGVDACVVATIVDGLVLARSAFHHSMNYRSVVVYGRAEKVEDAGEKGAALEAIVEHVLAGRSAGTRAPNEKEVKGTLVLRLTLAEASAKVRAGGPLDDEEDMGLPVWAGHVPLRMVAGDPVPAADLVAGAPPWPDYELGRGEKSP